MSGFLTFQDSILDSGLAYLKQLRISLSHEKNKDSRIFSPKLPRSPLEGSMKICESKRIVEGFQEDSRIFIFSWDKDILNCLRYSYPPSKIAILKFQKTRHLKISISLISNKSHNSKYLNGSHAFPDRNVDLSDIIYQSGNIWRYESYVPMENI